MHVWHHLLLFFLISEMDSIGQRFCTATNFLRHLLGILCTVSTNLMKFWLRLNCGLEQSYRRSSSLWGQCKKWLCKRKSLQPVFYAGIRYSVVWSSSYQLTQLMIVALGLVWLSSSLSWGHFSLEPQLSDVCRVPLTTIVLQKRLEWCF